jgi:hypothetical protein
MVTRVTSLILIASLIASAQYLPHRRGAFRVPEGGGSELPEISGLVLHYDASAETAYADNATVTTATDQSGNSKDGTAVGSPVYKTGILNGKAVYRFDGDDGFDASLATANTAYTLFIVSATTNASAVAYAVHNGNPASNGYGFIYYYSQRVVIHGGQGFWGDGNSTTSWEIATIERSTGSPSMWINGLGVSVTPPVNTGLNTPTTKTTVGYASNNFWLGDIAEVLIYDNALSQSDRDDVEDYLGTKYGITVTHD